VDEIDILARILGDPDKAYSTPGGHRAVNRVSRSCNDHCRSVRNGELSPIPKGDVMLKVIRGKSFY
jgi:hypothetical protein